MYEEYRDNQPKPTLAAGEAILWRGKPKKSAFLASRSLTLLPIAVLWLILDLGVLTKTLIAGEMLVVLVPFFAVHLMPVWIWLGSTITAGKRWKNTMYYVTDRRVIIQSGFMAVNEKSVFFKESRSAQLRIGIFDKIFGTGSIVLDDGYYEYRRQRNNPGAKLEYLEDVKSVYDRIQKTVLNIQNAHQPE